MSRSPEKQSPLFLPVPEVKKAQQLSTTESFVSRTGDTGQQSPHRTELALALHAETPGPVCEARLKEASAEGARQEA